MKKLILKKYFLWSNVNPDGERVMSLQEWLNGLLLHGKESIARTRFMKILNEESLVIERERMNLLGEYAEKDKDGKIIYLDKESKETTNQALGIKAKLKNEEELNSKFLSCLLQEFTIDITPENAKTIYDTRDLILNTEEKFQGIMATRFSEWYVCFEDLVKQNKKLKK